jgi:hypothetical protein
LGVTGNSEVSKDILQRQFNYISIDDKRLGIPFLKRILKRADIITGV